MHPPSHSHTLNCTHASLSLTHTHKLTHTHTHEHTHTHALSHHRHAHTALYQTLLYTYKIIDFRNRRKEQNIVLFYKFPNVPFRLLVYVPSLNRMYLYMEYLLFKTVKEYIYAFLNLGTQKPVFGVSDKARLKPVFSATETS